MTGPKQLCPGSGTPVTDPRVLPWEPPPYLRRMAKCPRCGRILHPSKTGKFNRHQEPNARTASYDRTLETLWEHAKPVQHVLEKGQADAIAEWIVAHPTETQPWVNVATLARVYMRESAMTDCRPIEDDDDDEALSGQNGG